MSEASERGTQSVRLTVAEAPRSDVGVGRARLDLRARGALGIDAGEVAEIIGVKTSGVRVLRSRRRDEGKDLIRLDGLVRRNVGANIGDIVEVRKAETVPAKRITLAPIVTEGHGMGLGFATADRAKRWLLERPLNKGDIVIVPGVGFAGGALPFVIATTDPTAMIKVVDGTVVTLQGEAVQASRVG